MAKVIAICCGLLCFGIFAVYASEKATLNPQNQQGKPLHTYKISSRIRPLKLALHFYGADKPSSAPPLLLLHGSSFPSKLSFAFKMSQKSWIDSLTSKGFDVYALDFLGYGDADRYPEMHDGDIDTAPLGRGLDVIEDVALATNFILSKHQARRLNLLGHSWGGAVAAGFAGQHPEKVDKLILYAAITTKYGVPSKSSVAIPAYSQSMPQDRLDALRRLSPDKTQGLLAKEVDEGWGQQWQASDPLSRAGQPIRFPAGPKADVLDFVSGHSFYAPGDITAQVLVIRGEHDAFPSDQQAKALFAQLTHARFKSYQVIKGGTHVAHLEKNRRDLYRAVETFLQNKKQ